MAIEYGRSAMAIAWGDQWTNMIQPFWALPALGVAGLKARDIMGYLVVVTIFTGIVACLGFLAWGAFFWFIIHGITCQKSKTRSSERVLLHLKKRPVSTILETGLC